MKSPILNWTYGITLLLGLPLGLLVMCSTGSLGTTCFSVVAIVVFTLLACRKDILREYKEKDQGKPARKRYVIDG